MVCRRHGMRAHRVRLQSLRVSRGSSATVRGLALLVAGCGRIGFSPLADSNPNTDELAYRAAVLADSPIAYWRLGDLGPTALDETGHDDGAYVGACQHGVAGALADDPNTAVELDGTTCEVTLGNNFTFMNNAPFTVELWVAVGPKAGYAVYFAMETRAGGGAGNPVDGYALFKGDPPTFIAERAVSGADILTPDQAVPTEPWVYLVCTYDGAQLELYVDAGSPSDRQRCSSDAVVHLGRTDRRTHAGGLRRRCPRRGRRLRLRAAADAYGTASPDRGVGAAVAFRATRESFVGFARILPFSGRVSAQRRAFRVLRRGRISLV